MSLRRGDLAPGNGLKETSDVMADKVVTVPRSVISPKKLGSLEREDLRRVDDALRFRLSL